MAQKDKEKDLNVTVGGRLSDIYKFIQDINLLTRAQFVIVLKLESTSSF